MKLWPALGATLGATLLAWLLVWPVQATTLAAYTAKKAEVVGTTRLTWLIWDVYDAALYSKDGTFAAQRPYVLELTYLRALDGGKIAAKSIEEMQRLGLSNKAKAAEWQTTMTDWFGGVEKGTRLAAMQNADGSTTFVKDSKKILGTIKDKAFTQYFFSIWLSKNTLKPTLREELLGIRKVAKR